MKKRLFVYAMIFIIIFNQFAVVGVYADNIYIYDNIQPVVFFGEDNVYLEFEPQFATVSVGITILMSIILSSGFRAQTADDLYNLATHIANDMQRTNPALWAQLGYIEVNGELLSANDFGDLSNPDYFAQVYEFFSRSVGQHVMAIPRDFFGGAIDFITGFFTSNPNVSFDGTTVNMPEDIGAFIGDAVIGFQGLTEVAGLLHIYHFRATVNGETRYRPPNNLGIRGPVAFEAYSRAPTALPPRSITPLNFITNGNDIALIIRTVRHNGAVVYRSTPVPRSLLGVSQNVPSTTFVRPGFTGSLAPANAITNRPALDETLAGIAGGTGSIHIALPSNPAAGVNRGIENVVVPGNLANQVANNGLLQRILDEVLAIPDAIASMLPGIIADNVPVGIPADTGMLQNIIDSIVGVPATIVSAVTALPGIIVGDMNLDFSKLSENSQNLISVFPFSIPFDFINAIQSLRVPARAPVFTIDLSNTVLSAGDNLTLDLSDWDRPAQVMRWGVWISFFVGLMFMTRKVIKW